MAFHDLVVGFSPGPMSLAISGPMRVATDTVLGALMRACTPLSGRASREVAPPPDPLPSPSVRYPVREPYVANTDFEWFDFLSRRAGEAGRVDEVNFWSPLSKKGMKRFGVGEPVFLRLKRPRYAIAGYGFFAAFHVLDLETCWQVFEWKNGDPDRERFLRRIGGYRGVNLLDPSAPQEAVGCTVLRETVFWPEHRWIPWGEAVGWPNNVVQGRTEREPANVERLISAMRSDELALPQEFEDRFVPYAEDERRLVVAERVAREGQGAFRLRLLDAYQGRCAITGEHTEPVLDAAHIQPYLGPRSNHLQNGLVLTKEFHALFDRGYVTITPDFKVKVSPRLTTDWKNGRRYWLFDGKALEQLPGRVGDRPSEEALVWHGERVFKRAG